MILLSCDGWKYSHFAAGRSFTHSPYTIYMGRGYTVVLEEKLRKYGLEFKEVNQQPEYGYPLFMSTPQ